MNDSYISIFPVSIPAQRIGQLDNSVRVIGLSLEQELYLGRQGEVVEQHAANALLVVPINGSTKSEADFRRAYFRFEFETVDASTYNKYARHADFTPAKVPDLAQYSMNQ